MSSKSKIYEDYDDDFNDFEDDYSATKQATSYKSVIVSHKNQTDQSSFRTNDNSNVNNSYDNDTSLNKKVGLSSRELKTKLIETFKNKGIFDSMKVSQIGIYYLRQILKICF